MEKFTLILKNGGRLVKKPYNKPQQSLPLVAGNAKALRLFVVPCAGRYTY